MGLIRGSGRSPSGGHGNLLQYSCQENPMDYSQGPAKPEINKTLTEVALTSGYETDGRECKRNQSFIGKSRNGDNLCLI